MPFSPDAYLGIDPTAGRHPFSWALFDGDCRLVTLAGGELEQVLQAAVAPGSALVAVNAPSCPNRGVVRALLAGRQGTEHPRGADMRHSEHILRERGISIPPTPSRVEACSAWIQMGLGLCKELTALGFQPFPAGDHPLQWLETNAHAVFCTLLGQVPLPKPTLEGRLQRQLALHSHGAAIADPMDFFEEITRHKLLGGRLPLELIHTPEELDTLASAFTAWSVSRSPEDVVTVGDESEGVMVLPVRELKSQYH